MTAAPNGLAGAMKTNLLVAAAVASLFGCVPQSVPLTLATFLPGEPAVCYDRATQPHTAVVDTHLHFRPFGGAALPFLEVVDYLERSGVLFANVYGIGQMLPVSSPCTYYLDCIGTPVRPTLKNDFVNAANVVALRPDNVRLVLSMTFPDLAKPDTVLAGMGILDAEFPGLFRWMGEVNLVKQALFGNGHTAVPMEQIAEWAPFMAVLRERDIPIAIHSDLGHDAQMTEYLPWIEEVLRLYPDNKIVWMHLGLSRELVVVDPELHVETLKTLLDRYPKLMLDLSWRVIEDEVLSDPASRPLYVALINAYSERFLPGTDFVASAGKNFDVYREELEVTGRIHRHLNDEAFRNIALGQNYFRLLNLDYEAPPVCPQGGRGGD